MRNVIHPESVNLWVIFGPPASGKTRFIDAMNQRHSTTIEVFDGQGVERLIDHFHRAPTGTEVIVNVMLTTTIANTVDAAILLAADVFAPLFTHDRLLHVCAAEGGTVAHRQTCTLPARSWDPEAERPSGRSASGACS